MLIGFLDDTELVVDGDDPAPDIFAFGGYFIPIDCLDRLQHRINDVKAQFGIPPWGPVKWNLKDVGLVRFYEEDHWLYSGAYDHLMENSDAIRIELLKLLGEIDARIFISARYDTNWREATHSEYYGWAFENLMQRVGLLFRDKLCEPCEASSTMVVVDWPQGGVNKNLFDIYSGGYHLGKGFSSHQPYFSGPIKQYRFCESLTHGSTYHSGPLQLADLVVGCCREFLGWAYTGKKPQRLVGKFELLVDHFSRDPQGRLNDCGFKIAKDSRINVEVKIQEYLDWLHQQTEEIPF
jgi:hypothetical protein